MAVLGKRKAREPTVSQESAEEIFRRHFEAQFAPIDDAPPPTNKPDGSSEADMKDGGHTRRSRADGEEDEGVDDDDEDDEEWGGLSEDDDAEESQDDEVAVEVVDHSSSQILEPVAMSKKELKAFMSSRPPDQTSTAKSTAPTASAATSATSTTLPEDAPSLLAQDLELRRLISESHLLSTLNKSSSSSTFSGADAGVEPKLFATGRIRQKTTDLRVQALGSKQSVFTQKSMPMNMRKGIVATAASKEAKRRRQAKENGVILEREVKTDTKRKRPNDMGVDMPGMGKFRGGELRLSASDVKGMESSRDVFGRRQGGRRR